MINYNPKIVIDGLVLYLDAANRRSYSGNGVNWNDLGGDSNDGTLINNPTFDDTAGGSIVFDGLNDYVDCGNTGLTMYCINTWVYLNSIVTKTTSQHGLFRYYDTSIQAGVTFGSVTGLVVDETLTILGQQGGGYTRTVIKDNIPSGWNNITFNWNGSNYDIFLNGVQKDMYSGGVGHVNLITASSGLFLGQSYVSAANRFDGKMSIFSIYNKSLTPIKIQQNYNALRSRYGI